MKVRSYIKGEWIDEGQETDLISAETVTNKTVAWMIQECK